MSPAAPALSSRQIALAGMVSLAVAMGIGRFAFTPLLPMMLHDGVVDLAGASWLASANYFGYVLGALLCVAQPAIWQHARGLPPFRAAAWVRAGLVATAGLTLGMALPWPALWPSLRFAAGVASGIVFVFTSGWCLARLAERGTASLGGLIYVGPGAGIALSGLISSGMVAADWRAAGGWLLFGCVAAGLSAAVWRWFDPAAVLTPLPAAAVATSGAAVPAAQDSRPWRAELAWLTFAYGLAGFGYIVTATFLPVIARQALPGSPWLDLFWPLFGLGVVIGALISTRLHALGDLRGLLAGCYLMQAVGIGVGLWSPTLAGFAIGSFLLGVPFTAITFFAMQEVRRLRPLRAAPAIGLLSAVYGVGQVVGPQMVAWLMRSGGTADGFTRSLQIAAAALGFGAVTYLGMIRGFRASAR